MICLRISAIIVVRGHVLRVSSENPIDKLASSQFFDIELNEICDLDFQNL